MTAILTFIAKTAACVSAAAAVMAPFIWLMRMAAMEGVKP